MTANSSMRGRVAHGVYRRQPASTEGVSMAYDFTEYESSEGSGCITLASLQVEVDQI